MGQGAGEGIPRWERALLPCKPALGTLVGVATTRTGTDVTDVSSRRSCLVPAPHPDDETLGCAVTIMRRLDAGSQVWVVVLSDGRMCPPERPAAENITTRAEELRQACRVLGLPDQDVHQLSFRDTALDRTGDRLVEAVADAVRTCKPDDVLATSEADPNADHAALGRACRLALAGSPSRLLSYPVWQWDRPRSWNRTRRTATRPELVRTAGYLDRKRQAIAVYRSQLRTSVGGDRFERGLDRRDLDHFLGRHELFFPVRPHH